MRRTLVQNSFEKLHLKGYSPGIEIQQKYNFFNVELLSKFALKGLNEKGIPL